MTFQSLLPTSSGLFEKAIEEVFGTALDAIEPELIKTFWEPDRIPTEHLSVLAHAFSVDLWDEGWDELKKRSVIRRWVSLEFAKGTYAGYRDFIEIAGGTLEQVILPPGGFFAAPTPTKEEWEVYLDANPRVRIQLARRTALDHAGCYADVSFLDANSFYVPDLGLALYGRRATLRMTKTSGDADLQLISIRFQDETLNAVDYEQVVLPAETEIGFYADHGYSDVSFVEAVDIGQRIFSFRLDSQYNSRTSTAWLNTLSAGFQPRDTTYYRVSDTRDVDAGFYADFSHSEACYVLPDYGAEMLADILYLFNPDVKAPQTADIGYADVSFLDFPRFRADMRIHLDEPAEGKALYADAGFAGYSHAMPEDPRRRDAVRNAIRAARAKRDKVMITFQNTRPRTLADGFRLGDGAQLDQPIPYSL